MGVDADLLICGICHQDFLLENLSAFLAHKKFDCDFNDQSQLALLCQSCPDKFTSPWQLLQHAQSVHAMKLFQDNRLIKQPDKTTTFTAAQSYVQGSFEDGSMHTVMEYSPHKSQSNAVGCQAEEEDMIAKVENTPSVSPLRERNEMRTKIDAATQVDDPVVEDGQGDDEEGSYCCCTNQNCGVTVMPGTHERLKACCNRVVPKKRKRHMETKHIPKTLLRRKKAHEGAKVRRNDADDIFIDVETSASNAMTKENERDIREQGRTMDVTYSPMEVRDHPQPALNGSKQKSVIIQPGTTFSIPVSYAVIEQSMIGQSDRSKNRLIPTDKLPTSTRPNVAVSRVNDPPVILLDPSRVTVAMSTTSQSIETVVNKVNQVALPSPQTLPLTIQQTKPDATVPASHVLTSNPGHPVPLIANQLFSRPHDMVGNTAGATGSTDSPTNATLDNTTREILSLVMGMKESGSKVDETSELTFKNNLVIDDGDSFDTTDAKQETGTRCDIESRLLVDMKGITATVTEDSSRLLDNGEPKTELLISDNDASQSGDSKSMKKRRYPTSRPFKCDQCSQAFNQRIHLRKHLSKHTGIKPFKCGQCDYSTVERSHLKVHIRVHTGEKPYKCTYCEYATAQNSTLKIHLKRHHDSQGGLMCPTCGKKFKQQENLETHYRQHASVEDQ